MIHKLLLTSAGLTNRSLVEALRSLVSRPFTECKAVFIPTAANKEAGHKDWLIENYNQCLICKFAEFDIVDIAALEIAEWQPRIAAADILFVGGGNTLYLQEQIVQSGLRTELETYDEKVWVGISAGSMVCTPTVRSIHSTLYFEEPRTDQAGLHLVPFYLLPHYNSEYFTQICDARLEEHFRISSDTTYVLDDESGIAVNGNTIEVISEGQWRKFH
jgi:dipeptidase E